MSTSYPPYYAYPSAPPLQRRIPKPPRLHWGWVLFLSILTVGVFGNVWLFVQGNWIRKMRGGKSTAFWLALVNMVWLPLMFLFAIAAGVAVAMSSSATSSGVLSVLEPLARIGGLVLYVTTVFGMRSEMQAQPIEMVLGGGMTLVFGPLYFQYNLLDYATGYGSAQEPGFGLGLSQPGAVPRLPIQSVQYPTAAEVGVVYPPEGTPPRD